MNRSRSYIGVRGKRIYFEEYRRRAHRRGGGGRHLVFSFFPFKGNPPTRDFVRRHFKAKDMEAFEATNAKFFNEKLESMWLENQAKYADKPADFDESQCA